MKYLFSLLLGTTLLAASCKKDAPEPAAPELLGRWNIHNSTAFNYSATGQLLSQDDFVEDYFYLEITRDSLHYRDVTDGHSLGSDHYTRQGNLLTYGRNNRQLTITELNDHHLTLRFPDANRVPNTPYQEIEEHYMR